MNVPTPRQNRNRSRSILAVGNPIRALVEIAQANHYIARQHLRQADSGLPWSPWLGSFKSEPAPESEGIPLYGSIELAGEAGLYRHIQADPDLEILYTGAFAWSIRGIDTIARRRSTGRYIICEAKGTAPPLAASPLSYLSQACNKGRQLTWKWCWNSLLDMADRPATAQAFLKLLGPFLEGEVERLLTISQVERLEGKGETGYGAVKTRMYEENELNGYPMLAAGYALAQQSGMFLEMRDN